MKVYTLGGYNEVGRNMTAVEYQGEVVIFDMGLHMDKITTMDEDERDAPISVLRNMQAIPDDRLLNNKKVVAIVVSHGHLDHIGAVTLMAERHRCPIYSTPYTITLLKKMAEDEQTPYIFKRAKALEYRQEVEVGTKGMRLVLINVTHSIPHSSIIVLKTKEGNVVYINDYKLDNSPTLGEKTDYKYLKSLGKEGVKVLIMESLRAHETSRTPSEAIAKQMVKDVVNRAYEDKGAVFISSFSSHIARLNAIIEANKDRRKIVMLGRSLKLYTDAAKEHNLINLEGIEVKRRRKQIISLLKKVNNNKEDYLVVSTGNQGEHDAVLTRIARGEYFFDWEKRDNVILSSKPIPHPNNIANRYMLKQHLSERGVRIIDEIHVSGHARREDSRDMIRWLNPEYIIPSHADVDRTSALASLAREEGYKIGRDVIISYNGNIIDIS